MSFKKDFPFFQKNPDIIYLDNAATSQKPSIVIDKEREFYEKYNCNIHRTSGKFAFFVEEQCERTRSVIANFIKCDSNEIFFTYSTTYGINYLSYFLCLNYLSSGDEVIISEMEHHASLLPFLNLSQFFGFKIKFWKMNEKLELDIVDLERLLTEKTKLIVVTHMSNVLGVVNDIEKISDLARKYGIMVLVDGAQGIVHNEIDLTKVGIDFYVFSAHKLYGPFGLGVVYINKKHFDRKIPAFVGGSMVKYVSLDKVSYLDPPMFFEPGTQSISQIFAFKYSIEYLQRIGLEKIKQYELDLTNYCINKMLEIENIRIYGYGNPSFSRFSIIPFNVVSVHPHDIAFILDEDGIMIRVGHHCAQPIHNKLGIPGSCRVSLAFYNTYEDIDIFITSLKKAVKFFFHKR